MPYAKAKDGCMLYYKDWGQGDPVVLLHGWPLSADTWDDAAIKLVEAGHRCVFPDRRGFGRSDQPWNGHDYDTYADDVAAVLEDAGINEPVTLVGFSMGGGEVARFLTKQGKARVKKAVLISSVVPYMLKTDDNPNGVPQSTFDQMTQGMKTDRARFLPVLLQGLLRSRDRLASGQRRGFDERVASGDDGGTSANPRRGESLCHHGLPARPQELRRCPDPVHSRDGGHDGADRRQRTRGRAAGAGRQAHRI